MTRGEALKRALTGITDENELLLCIVNDDLDTIGVHDAIRIWEKLNEELPGTKKMDPEPKKAPEPKPASKKKPLDDKKMLALRKAGWSYEKIADEMG